MANGKGDVVGDFVASCQRVGIKPGIFYSVHRNVYQQVWGHYVTGARGGAAEKEKFNHIGEQQMEELCSRYGPLIQIWLDAGAKTPAEGGPDMLPIFRRCQPHWFSITAKNVENIVGSATKRVTRVIRAGRRCRTGDGLHRERRRRKLLGIGDPDGTAGRRAWWTCRCAARPDSQLVLVTQSRSRHPTDGSPRANV